MSIRRNSPSSASWPTAGGTRTASSGRCTRSTRCGWTGSIRWPRLHGKARARRRLRRRHPGRGDGAPRRGGHRHRPGQPSRSRWRSCTRSRPASQNVEYREVAAEALAAETAGALRRRDLHGDARARARPGVGRAGLRRAGASPAAGCSSRRSTATRRLSCSRIVGAEHVLQAAAQGHARVRALHPAQRTGALVPRCRPGASRHSRGMEYNPLTRRYWLSADTSVNYLLACRKPA